MTVVLNQIKARIEEADEELLVCDDEEKPEINARVEQYKQAPGSLNDLTGRVAIIMREHHVCKRLELPKGKTAA